MDNEKIKADFNFANNRVFFICCFLGKWVFPIVSNDLGVTKIQ